MRSVPAVIRLSSDGASGCSSLMDISPRQALAILLGLAIALGAGGCGGDTRRGESETSEAAAGGPAIATKVTDPARRVYVARVDAVCRRFDPERSKTQERVANASLPAEAAKTYDETIGLGRSELRRIEAIPAPPGEDELLRANVFDVIRRELAIRGEIGGALSATDVPRLRRLRGELDSLSRSLGGFARGYGFRVCGED